MGRVLDAESREPVPYAAVTSGSLGTYADEQGQFRLKVPLGEMLELDVHALGYEDYHLRKPFPPALAEPLEILLQPAMQLLKTAVVTSGRFEKPIAKTTVSLEVLKPRLLDATHTIAIDDGLSRLAGVDVVDGQANIRGGSGYSYGAGSRVLLLLDGMPIMQTDAAFPNWKDMPVENIGQVEILKGAASTLYGSSAMNGIVNIRTAVPTNDPYIHVSTYYRRFLKPKNKDAAWWNRAPFGAGGSLVYRQRIRKWGITLGGAYHNETSYIKDVYTKYGRAFGGVRYAFSQRLEAGIHAYFNPGNTATSFYWQDDTTGIFLPGPNSLSKSHRLRYNIDPYVKWHDRHDNFHKWQGRYFSADNQNSNNQSVRSDMRYGEYQFLHRFRDIHLTLTAGASAMFSHVSAELYGDTTYRASNLAGYIQLEKTWKRLTLAGGIRYEANRQNSPELIPVRVFGTTTYDTVPGGVTQEAKPVFRAGLNYRAGQATFLRASYGQAYRYPTIAEKFISAEFGGGVPILPNVHLHAETGYSVEVGVKQGLRFGHLKAFADVAFFLMRYKDMMEFSFGGLDGSTFGFASINIGHTRIKGVDFAVAGEWSAHPWRHRFMLGYLHLDPRYVDFSERIRNSSSSEENILKYRFRHSFKADWETRFNNYSFGLSVLHSGEVKAVDFLLEDFIEGARRFREQHKGFTRLDMRAGVQITEVWRLSLAGENILNALYSVRVGKAEPPRNISIRLDYTLGKHNAE